MRANLLPAPSLASTFLHNPFILIAGALAWLSPLALSAQSVTFAGTQTTLPTSGLSSWGSAVDGAGDVFIADTNNDRLVELPRTATGYGPQTTILQFGLQFDVNPVGVAVDSAGDVFIIEGNGRVVELPRTATGFGPLSTLPFSGLSASGVAVDSGGDVFIVDEDNRRVVELPRTATGYGPQTTLPLSLDLPLTVAVDSTGDLFIMNEYVDGHTEPRSVLELQTHSVNFGGANVCVAGQPAPCSVTLSLTFNVNADVTLGTPKVLTGGAPNLDFTLASGSTCTGVVAAGTACTVNVTFAPLALGTRNGSVEIIDGSGNVLTTTPISGYGVGVLNAPVLSLPSGVYATAQTVSITDSVPGAIYYTTNGTAPTASSTPYTGPISVTSTETLEAINIAIDAPSAIATATYNIASGTPANALNFSQGFSQAQGPMQFNGSTDLDGPRLQLTNAGQFQAGSAFYATLVNIQSFTTNFTFQLSDPFADGFTFTIQNIGAGALGAYGKALGYAPIGKSVAIKFDLHNNAGEGPNSTGLYVDGALPTVPAVNLTGTGIDLHSGHSILAQITYDGTNLVLTLTDTVTLASWSHSFAINIPATVCGDTAYIGFTGGTGSVVANQEIFSWTYISGAPGPPAPPPSIPAAPDYPAAFNGVGLATNGSAVLSGNAVQLTDGGQKEAGSAFYASPVTIDHSFTTDFTFQLSSPNASVPLANIADGITFTILNAERNVVAAGDNALGDHGSALGFAGIVNDASGGYNNFDMAIKFDLHNSSGEGPDSTGLYVNGAMPTVPAIDLTGTGIDLHSGHPFMAHIAYDYAATNLTLTLTDTVTAATWKHSFTIDIPKTIGGTLAYIGFTGGTGADVAVQQILNWTFTNP